MQKTTKIIIIFCIYHFIFFIGFAHSKDISTISGTIFHEDNTPYQDREGMIESYTTTKESSVLNGFAVTDKSRDH